MNNHDPIYEHYHAQHINTNTRRDSFPTNLATLLLFLFIILPIVLDTSHQEAARRILAFACRMAVRVSSRLLPYSPFGLQKSVGGGGALKNVFGIESGLLKKGLNSLKGARSNAPPGLGNMNNSCYQNSVVQGLASIRSFRHFLNNVSSKDSSPSSINTALLNTIEYLNSPENHGCQLWLPSALKTMSTWQQQDAQEYFSNVLDQVDKEVDQEAKRRMSQNSGLEKMSLAGTAIEAKAVATSTRSSAHKSNPLEGLLAQRVGCTKCGYSDGLSMIPFNNLTVPLGARSLYDVRDCLDEYSKLEYIEGVQCPKCTLLLAQDKYKKMLDKEPPESLANDIRHRLEFVEGALEDEDFSDAALVKKCNIPKKQWVSSTKSKQAVIGRAPKSFIIHINRSIFNEYTGTQEKNNAAVRFPLFFNLDTWCLGKSFDFAEENAHIENWSMDPNESMLADPQSLPKDENDQSRSPSNYELRAVVTHFGRHENGHYVCYRKAAFSLVNGDSVDGDPSMNEPPGEAKEAWWRLSDEDVTLVSEEYVLRQGGVFMLFYECIDGSETPLQSRMQAEEICVGVAKPAEIDMEEIAQIPLPDDCDKDFESLDELSVKTKPSLAPWTLNFQQGPPPDTSSSPRQENSDESALAGPEEQQPTLIDSATETETEDLFQSTTAATGNTPAPSRGRIRMRTSSAFTASSSAEDPLQIPIRMGTAF